MLCLFAMLQPPMATQAQAVFPFPLNVTFKDATTPANWVLGGKAVLTSGTADPTGNGWLRLTNNTGNQAGFAYYNMPIPTGRGLVVTFDYAAWGGTGADGLSFFLFDGATKIFNVGASGGSLGYAQKTGIKGLSGGYLGLGLDEFGNYPNNNEGRVGGIGFTPQAVAIRGPGTGTSGYAYLAGTTRLDRAPWSLPRLDCPANTAGCSNGANRPLEEKYFRQVQIIVTPVGAAYQVKVAMKFSKSDVTWTHLFGPFTMPTSAPGTLKMGFAASTGGSTNYHEIRNLNVTQQVPDLTATKAVQNATTGGGSVAPDEELLYTVVLRNNTNLPISGVHVTDPIPTNTTYVAGSIAAPTGATINATDPISISTITVPANGQAVITFKVRVDNPIPLGVTQISNQGSYTYGTVTAQTDGDTQTEGAQPTLIGVTAGPNFDTSTKTVTYEDVDNNGAVSPGDILTYRIELPNSGNQDAPTVSVVDALPPNTTYVTNSATVSAGTISYNGTTKTLNWTISVDAGDQEALDFKVTINSSVKIRDMISNQGVITYGSNTVLTDADPTIPGKQPTVILAGGGATLVATKFAEVIGGGNLQPGGQVRYTIQLTNTGSYSVTGATFSDAIPTHTSYMSASSSKGTAAYSDNPPTLSVTGIDLAGRESATIQLTVRLSSPLSGVIQVSNQGVVNYDSNQGGVNNTTLQTDGDPSKTGQQPTVTLIPNTDLSVTKALVNNNPAEAGTVVYTLNVRNHGPVAASQVTVADLLPAGLMLVGTNASAGSYTAPNWNIGSLIKDGSASLTITATVNVGAGGSTITNTASVTSTLYDANPVNNTSSTGLLVQITTLSGTVTDIETGAPLVGVTLTITDSQGNTCTATTGAGGAYMVTSGQNGCLLAPGVASVGATGGAPSGYLLRAADTTIVAGAANIGNLTLVKPSLSGVVTDLGSGVTLVGATVTMTQGSLICTTTAGAGGTYSFVPGTGCDLTAGPATVTATMTGYQDETATPTILDSGPTTQNLALGTADLLITKNDGKTVVQPGELLDYVIVVSNLGSIAGTGIVVTDTLPAFVEYISSTPTAENPAAGVYVWRPADLVPGDSVSFTLQARVAISLPDGVTRLANYVNLRATSPDRDRTNNEVSDVNTVAAHPDLTLLKSATADSSPIYGGSTITYTYIGDNRGSAIATGVHITDTLDANIEYEAGSAVLVVDETAWPLAATYDSGLHRLLLEIPDMPPGAEGYLRYRATVANPLPFGTTLVTNTAEVTSNEMDLDPRDNRSTVVLSTQSGADIYVQKVALSPIIPALPGGELLYRLRYGNLTSALAPGAVITDVIPDNTTYVPGSLYRDGVNLSDAAGDDDGLYTSASRTISVSLGNLAGGASGIVTFTVRIDDVLPAGVSIITNTATITSSVEDPVLSNNQSTALMDVDARPDLTITKSDGRTQVLAGDLLAYTITYSNTGNQAATGVTVTDTLLSGIDYIDATPGGVYANGVIVWNLGDLVVNEARTLTVTARVRFDVQPGSVVANRAMVGDDGDNGEDINPAGNTFTDSNVVIAPYLLVEKRAASPVYVGQPVTYTIDSHNSQAATAYNAVVTDVLPANTTLVPGSITMGGVESGGVITWNMGDMGPGITSTLSFAVIPQIGAGGMTQTLPTLSTEDVQDSLILTSSATAPAVGSWPWCDFEGCASFKGIYQGENGMPPVGWNDNPRLTQFDEIGWTHPVPSSTAEFIYWVNPAELDAEWVTMHTLPETIGNFTFFRQNFCMPLNATGLSASIQIAGDDVTDLYLNGIYLGQEIGAGAAERFDVSPGLQPGLNLLSVQLLNNRHGGHAAFGGGDHSGLIFNLGATFTGVRPFAAAPSMVLAGQTVLFSMVEQALDSRSPYSYTIDFGDGTSADYQSGVSFTHPYVAAGVYTATVTARSTDGCTGRDLVIVHVLSADANLLANPVIATSRDANNNHFAAQSGAGVQLLPAADLSVLKTIAAGGRVPGQMATYQITVTNNGPNDVTGATVQDKLPALLTGVVWTCGGATCTSSGSGDISDTVDLLAGATITYTVTGTIPTSATGLLENTVVVTAPANVTDLIPENNTSTDSGALTPQVNLSVSKVSSPKPGLAPGYPVRYVIRVDNAGPSDAVNVLVTDTFPANITGANWTCVASNGSSCTPAGSGDLTDTVMILAGGALTYTTMGRLAPEAAVGAAMVNTATVAYADALVSATDSNTLMASTTLVATKEALGSDGNPSHTLPFIDADSSGGISPGDTLKYRVVIGVGAATAYNVVFDDSLNVNTWLRIGTVTCNPTCTVVQGNTELDSAVSVRFDSLAANGFATIEYEVTIADVLPFQLATIANQGFAASVNAPAIATDDPSTSEPQDRTVVQLAMGSIGGIVWADDNNNGMKDAGELLLPNVTVTLGYTDTDGGGQFANTATDANGAYTFTVLAAGAYRIEVALNDGFRYGDLWGAGKDNKIDQATGATAAIDLAPNQQVDNISSGQISVLAFGYLPTSFANTMLAQDGARHVVPETEGDLLHLGAIIVTSADGVESPTASGPGDGILRPLTPAWTPNGAGALTVTATSMGQLWGWFDWNYNGQFDPDEAQELGDVITGTQTVRIVAGATYSAAQPLFARFRLYSAEYALDYVDTGIVYNGEVEDYGWYASHGVVFDDVNGDGQQDEGDAGLAGQTVTFRSADGAILGTTQTITDGFYVMAGFTTGVYTVELTLPAKYVAITPLAVETIVNGEHLSVDFAIQAQPDLALSKGASPEPVAAGENLLYTLSVTNTNAFAQGVLVTDTLPGATTFVSASSGCTEPTTGVITCVVGEMDISATHTLTIAVRIQPTAPSGVITNTATTTSSKPDPTPDDNYADAVSLVTRVADLGVAKGSAPSSFVAGQAITYTVVVTNAGPSALTAITLTDNLPASLTSPTYTTSSGSYTSATGAWTGLSLGAGERVTLTINGLVSLLQRGDLTNTVTVATPQALDPNPDNNSATDVNLAVPGIVIAKSAAVTSYSAVGEAITYTYVVTNVGNVSIAKPFTVIDDKIGSFACPQIAPTDSDLLAPGGSVTCTATYRVAQADLDAGSVTNIARASSGDVASSSVTVTVSANQQPALALAKSAAVTSYSAVGEAITYTYVVTNVGNVSMAKPFTVIDDKIGSFACPQIAPTDSDLLAPGGSVTCTATYSVAQADLDAGSVTNVAYATNGVIVSLPATVTVIASQQPSLVTAKSAAVTSYSTVGEVVTYTYVVTNTGNVSVAKPFTVIDDKIGSFACPQMEPARFDNLAPGDFVTCAAAYSVAQADLDAGSLTNVAYATNGVVSAPAVSVTVTALLAPPTVLTGTVLDAATTQAIPGATVVVTDSTGHVYVTVSNADGRYVFTGTLIAPLDAGSATVTAIAPGYDVAVEMPTIVAAQVNMQDLQLTPAVLTGVVMGIVYIDANGDGAYTPGTDTPLPGASVVITACDGVTHTITTDGDGYYEQAVPSGQTTITVEEASLPEGLGITIGNVNPAIVTVPSSGQVMNHTGYAHIVLGLQKLVTPGQPDAFKLGDDIRFTIVFTNASVISVRDVVVTEYIPNGLGYSPNDDNGWTLSHDGRIATKIIAEPLAPGTAQSVDVVMCVETDQNSMVVNLVSVNTLVNGSGEPLPDPQIEAEVPVRVETPTSLPPEEEPTLNNFLYLPTIANE